MIISSLVGGTMARLKPQEVVAAKKGQKTGDDELSSDDGTHTKYRAIK